MSSEAPVRLRVAYKSAESLLGELTRSVGRGGVRIESKKALAVGTHFVFELRTAGVKERVEVAGTVVSVTQSAPGRFVLHIKYEAPRERDGIEAVLQKIFDGGRLDRQREHPRIPMHVRAVEASDDTVHYRLRDLSRGGVGVDIEGSKLPSQVKVGLSISIDLKITTGHLRLNGTVAWVVHGQPPLPAGFGVAFGRLGPQTAAVLDQLLAFRALPAPPWIAKLAFDPR